MAKIPMAHLGKVRSSLPDWVDFNDPDPDDEEFEGTPREVVMVLGFDPKAE